jgi:sigma-54 dependent transcriptional regulator, acetoin dehydrogenase operon transcriptional activator AcoR
LQQHTQESDVDLAAFFGALLFGFAPLKLHDMTAGIVHWDQFVEHLRLSPPSLPMPLCIRASWERCTETGVSRAVDNNIVLKRVSDLELQTRTEKNRELLEVATALITAFSSEMVPVRHVVYLTDRDGIILLSRGNDQLMLAYGLCPGFDWSEQMMGTNGAGTALATDSAVAVVGPDHYQLPFREATCLASPIHSATGELIGAVDFSTHVGDVDPSQLVQIVGVAKAIENTLTLRSDHGRRPARRSVKMR